MNYKLKIVFLVTLIVTLIFSCDNSSVQPYSKSAVENPNSTNDQILIEDYQSSEINEERIKDLIKKLKTNDTEQINNVKDQLLKISGEDIEQKEYVNFVLINETKKLCSANAIMNGMQFNQLTTMSELLSEFQNVESLEILIDCSDHTTSATGLSAYNYPTINPVANFKDKAIPTLKKKLSDNSTEKTKCNIANILTLIGSELAESTLSEALHSETNESVSRCLTAAIGTFRNNK